MPALPRRSLVALTALLATGIGLFAAYCQLHALAAGVTLPKTAAVTWGLIAGAPTGAMAFTIWHYRDQAKTHLSIQLAVTAFLLILVWGITVRGVLGLGRMPNASELAEQLFVVLPVAIALVCLAFIVLQRRAAVTNAVPLWIELPEEPLLRLRANDVKWVSAAGNYCEFHLTDRTHLIRLPLTVAAARLAPQGFARAHRSALVNLSALRSVEVDGARRKAVARLDCGMTLPISQRYREDLLAALSTCSSH